MLYVDNSTRSPGKMLVYAVKALAAYYDCPPQGLREGQRAFLALQTIWKHVAEEVRGAPFDPHNDNARLDAFYAWLEKRGNEQEDTCST